MDSSEGTFTDNLEEIHALDVPSYVIDMLCEDEGAVQALEALDIGRDDHKYLSDILDPDQGGTIRVVEFVEGLRRLRGDPRRSDLIACDLMLRSLQGITQ